MFNLKYENKCLGKIPTYFHKQIEIQLFNINIKSWMNLSSPYVFTNWEEQYQSQKLLKYQNLIKNVLKKSFPAFTSKKGTKKLMQFIEKVILSLGKSSSCVFTNWEEQTVHNPQKYAKIDK